MSLGVLGRDPGLDPFLDPGKLLIGRGVSGPGREVEVSWVAASFLVSSSACVSLFCRS